MMQFVWWNPMVPELLVSDFAASHSFYVRTLGFGVRFERANPSFAYLELGRAQLMIEEDHPHAWRTADVEHPRGRGCNLQIEVDDAAALRDHVVATGCVLFRDLADVTYDTGGVGAAQQEFLVQDPDGYLLRFIQPLE